MYSYKNNHARISSRKRCLWFHFPQIELTCAMPIFLRSCKTTRARIHRCLFCKWNSSDCCISTHGAHYFMHCLSRVIGRIEHQCRSATLPRAHGRGVAYNAVKASISNVLFHQVFAAYDFIGLFHVNTWGTIILCSVNHV